MQPLKVFCEPCYYAETVYLLHNYMNHISYEREYDRVTHDFGWQFLERDNHEVMTLRIHELTRISREVTEGLDREQERLRYYFEKLPSLDPKIGCCLAQILLLTVPLHCCQVDDFARELVRGFSDMMQIGMKINDVNSMGLIVEQRDIQEEPESLACQLERLPFTVEAKWIILRALTDFEAHVRELTELIRPVAEKLPKAMSKLIQMNEPLLEEWGAYFETHTVDDFQNEMFNTTFLFAEENVPHEIWLGLWNFNFLGTWSEWFQDHKPQPVRLAYIGIGISFDFAANRKQKPDEEALCTMLRALSGKDKLETLRRCAEQPISAARLASAMNLNSGTVSRNLYGLFKMGFLETRGDGERVNYVTRMDSLQHLFGWIMEYVEGRK